MKIHFIKLTLISALILLITATGCLKDKAYEKGTIQSGSQGSGQNIKVISLGITVSSSNNFLQASFPITGSDTTVDLIPVELGGTSAATQDIHVTLTVNDQLLIDYNAANGTDYANPGSIVTILNTGGVVTIPKGSRIGYLQVKFNANDLLSGDYALGLVITSVTEAGYTISGNLNSGIVGIGPKNKYDGKYKLTIETVGWGAYGINDGPPSQVWPSLFSIVTSGASSVIFSSEAGNAQPAFAGGITGFGATEPQLTFDPTTDKLLSVVNLVADDGRGRAFAMNPAVTDSRYDAATQTIYAAYLMFQNGRPTQYIYDTLVYKAVR